MDKQAIIQSIIASSSEIVVIVGACIILLGSLLAERLCTRQKLSRLLTGATLLVLILAAGMSFIFIPSPQTVYGNTFIIDPFALYFKAVIFLTAGLTLLMSGRYLEQEGIVEGEYHVLVLFAVVGMMIMVSGLDLLVIYMGLELQAFAFYVLVGFRRGHLQSNEAALKYVVLGAVSSGILLYGLSLIYGATGTTQLTDIASMISKDFSGDAPPDLMLVLAVIFLLAGLIFKVGAVPLHMWVPDVYEGAPTPITAFLSVGSKAAAFAIVLRIFLDAMTPLSGIWSDIIIVISVVTMALGSFVALVQTNIKRMLAYSSIAHAGFALLGVIAAGHEGIASVMLYLLIYLFMNIGFFAIVVMMQRDVDEIKTPNTASAETDLIQGYSGLASVHPGWAFLALLFLFSLAGIPPTAGFFAKFYILVALIQEGYVALSVLAVLLSAVAAFFYIRIVMLMYMKEPVGSFNLSLSPSLRLVLGITAIGTIGIGLAPVWFLSQAQNAVFFNAMALSGGFLP
ncbi:NADH-quinone oxidoreductase subunit N [Kiloniella sp.]|uniref:NADH-quinone oxidoreductase subunit N n=1 Tax=Kiloniella sp. TaxID=1938587 RepID=UPI003B01D818